MTDHHKPIAARMAEHFERMSTEDARVATEWRLRKLRRDVALFGTGALLALLIVWGMG